MGMYTSINDSTVTVNDMEGLKKWLTTIGGDLANGITIHEEEGTIDFDKMDGWKIIGYWYDDFCKLMRDIAVFLENGYIEMSYENSDYYAHIEFNNGECLVTLGVMEYQAQTEISDIFPKVGVISPELKKRLVLRKMNDKQRA